MLFADDLAEENREEVSLDVWRLVAEGKGLTINIGIRPCTFI